MTAKSRRAKQLKKIKHVPTPHEAISIVNSETAIYKRTPCTCEKGTHHFVKE